MNVNVLKKYIYIFVRCIILIDVDIFHELDIP